MQFDSITRWFRRRLVATAVVFLAACGGGDPDKQIASAKAYLTKGETRSAVIELKTVLQKEPDRSEARYLLGKALLESDDPIGATVELRKAMDLKHSALEVTPLLARAMLEQGQAADVVAQFGATALEDKAAQASLMTTVANAHARLGQDAKADAAIRQALAAAPGYVPAQVTLARLTASRGQLPEALAAIEATIAGGAADADAWALQGDLLAAARNDRAGALSAYRKALGVDPKHLASHSSIIGMLLQARDIEGATAQVAALQAARPGHPTSRFFTAQLAFEKRDFKTAREAVQQLLKGAPDHPMVNQLAGAIELASGSTQLARSYLGKALQVTPGNVAARRMLAAATLRAGENDKALELLEPLVSAPTPDPMALALAGEARMQAGDLDKAAELFARSAKANPNNVNTQTALARTRFLKGDAVGAVADLERIAAGDTGTTADLELVNSQLRRGDFRGALKAIDGLDKKQPDKALPSHLRGIAFQGLKDNAQARASYAKALGIDAAFFPAAFNLARMDLAEKRPQDAQARMTAVLKAQPGNLRAMLALADLKVREGAPAQEVTDLLSEAVRANPAEAGAHLSLINHHLANKRNDAAVSAAQQADAALPDQPAILDALGRAQSAAGQQNQAMATYNKILALQPKSAAAHLRLADANIAAKNTEGAIQGLKRAIAAQPNAPVLYQRLFLLEVQAGRTPAALQVARDVQRRQPKHSLGWVLEGDAQRLQKNSEGALAAYKTGLAKVQPTDAAVRYHALLGASGRAEDAEKFAAGWTKDQPNDAGFALYQADAAMARSDYSRAETLYRRVMALQPNNVLALNNVAWLMAKSKQPGAVALAERANELRPNQPLLMDTLAMALAADQRLDQAIELQKKALALQPGSDVLKLGMARLYVQAGQKAPAKELLEPLAQQGDKFKDHAEVKNLLSTL